MEKKDAVKRAMEEVVEKERKKALGRAHLAFLSGIIVFLSGQAARLAGYGYDTGNISMVALFLVFGAIYVKMGNTQKPG